MPKSDLEATFDLHIRALGLPEPEREYRFHPTRRWRFDFAWPDRMLAVEIEGGVWSRGRHTRGSGFVKDCEKYAEAALLGWRVIRIPGTWLQSGEDVALLERLFGGSSDEQALGDR